MINLGQRKLLGILGLVCLAIFSGCVSRKADSGRVISVWHWMTDREPVFQELAKRYTEKTGIKIEFDLYAPSDAYSQKVRAAAQGTNLPDIFGILGEKRDFASFIKAGHVLNLTPYVDEMLGIWRNKFFAKALAVNEFPDGQGNDKGKGPHHDDGQQLLEELHRVARQQAVGAGQFPAEKRCPDGQGAGLRARYLDY